MAGELDITLNQGETFFQNFQWKYINGEPVDLMGHVGRCQIRNGANNQGILKTVPVVITDAVNGKFYITLTATETTNIATTGSNYNELDAFDYDIEFETTTGVVYRVLNGKIMVSPEVTR